MFIMKIKRDYSHILIILSLFILSCLLLPSIAYAGTSWSPGGAPSTGGGGGGGGYTWEDARDGLYWKKVCNSTMPWGEYTSLGAYTHSDAISAWNKGKDWMQWTDWAGLMNLGTSSMDTLNKKALSLYSDSQLVDELVRDNFVIQAKSTAPDRYPGGWICWWWNRDRDQFADAVWISKQVKDVSEPRESMYYADADGQGTSKEKVVIVDEHLNINDPKSLEKIFNNPECSGEYTDYSLQIPNGQYDRDITYDVVTITHQQTELIEGNSHRTVPGRWVVENGEFVCKDSTEYIFNGTQHYTPHINYTPTTPNPTQEKYTPFNLNLNTWAKPEDTGEWAATEYLDGTVDNTRNINDNTAIETLDINNDALFTLNFTPGTVFGMKGENEGYDWTTIKDAGAIDTEQNFKAKSSDISAAKKNESCKSNDSWYRHDAYLYEGVNDISGSDIGLTSLYDKEKEAAKEESEKIAGKGDIVRHWAADNVWEKGTYGTRAISGGNYTLGSAKGKASDGTSKDWSNWWVSTYRQGKYYEYGISYRCNISKHGVSIPTACAAKDPEIGGTTLPNFEAVSNSNGWELRSDYTNKGDRGLYTAYGSKQFKQPVLCGKFKVKTLAGAVN